MQHGLKIQLDIMRQLGICCLYFLILYFGISWSYFGMFTPWSIYLYFITLSIRNLLTNSIICLTLSISTDEGNTLTPPPKSTAASTRLYFLSLWKHHYRLTIYKLYVINVSYVLFLNNKCFFWSTMPNTQGETQTTSHVRRPLFRMG
jgi:hypothetical protein